MRNRAIDRYLSDPDLTVSEAATEVGVTERTLTRWLSEHRQKDMSHAAD